MGELLTEMGRVEFTMLLFVDYISEAPIEHLFDEYSKLTFKDKIKWLKKWSDFSGVAKEKRPVLEKVLVALEVLRNKRNFVVHGETWQGSLKGKGRRPYRVGVMRDNLDYLDEFDRGQHGENVFTEEQIMELATSCRSILRDLNFLRGAKELPE